MGKWKTTFHHIYPQTLLQYSAWGLYTLKSAIRKSKASPDLCRALHSHVQVFKQRLNHQQVFALHASTSSCSSPPQAIYGNKSSERAKGRAVVVTRHWGVKWGRQNYRQGLAVLCEDFGDSQNRKSCKCLSGPSCEKNREGMSNRQPALGKVFTWKHISFDTHNGAPSILRSCRVEVLQGKKG